MEILAAQVASFFCQCVLVIPVCVNNGGPTLARVRCQAVRITTASSSPIKRGIWQLIISGFLQIKLNLKGKKLIVHANESRRKRSRAKT